MTEAWRTPVTNWAQGDYYERDDWNRQTGNIRYLAEAGLPVAGVLPLQEMKQVGPADIPYPDVVNPVEHNYDLVCGAIYPSGDFPPGRKMAENEPCWDDLDFNRIESACLRALPYIEKSKATRPQMSLVMGGGEIGPFI
ncbi:hypothetical protein LJC60_06280 [Ruminococcaceae bacterium OttesenSCG-928-D13]|nr:hypothetical protein [Ruminococcaceae bacterium OttesenSCG-928-D13]